jgi:hypothetical protein
MIHVNGDEAGRVTGAVTSNGRTRALAQVAWDARGGPFRTSAGIELKVLDHPASG